MKPTMEPVGKAFVRRLVFWLPCNVEPAAPNIRTRAPITLRHTALTLWYVVASLGTVGEERQHGIDI